METVNEVNRSPLWNKIFSIVSQIPMGISNGDAMDYHSCTTAIEQMLIDEGGVLEGFHDWCVQNVDLSHRDETTEDRIKRYLRSNDINSVIGCAEKLYYDVNPNTNMDVPSYFYEKVEQERPGWFSHIESGGRMDFYEYCKDRLL